MKKSKYLIFLILSTVLSFNLISCATEAPYTDKQKAADDKIKEEIRKIYEAEKFTYLSHVDITVYKGTVVLGGLVFQPHDRRIAIEDAKKVEGVKSISDQMEVESNAY